MARIGKVMIKKLTEDENEIRSRIYFDGRIIGEMNSSLDEESPIEAVTLKINPLFIAKLEQEAAAFFRTYEHAFEESHMDKMIQVVTYLKILTSLDALEDTFRDISVVTQCSACLYIEYKEGTSFMPAERKNLEVIESILRNDRNVLFTLLMDKDTFDIQLDEMSAKDYHLMHILH